MKFFPGLLGIWAIVATVHAGILEKTETIGKAGFQHSGILSEIVCLKDGRHVLSTSRDGFVRLWEIETGRLVRSYSQKDSDSMWGVRVLPGEEEFIVASSSGDVFQFSIASGSLLKTYNGPQYAYRISLHPDGKRFVGTHSSGVVILWNLETGEEIRRFADHTGDVYTSIIVGDGKVLITGADDNTFKKWDLETGKLLETAEGRKKAKYGDIYTLAASPDGARFAMVSGDDCVRVFESDTLKEVWKRELPGESQVVAWSPDGKSLAATSADQNLYVLNAADGEIQRAVEVSGDGHTPIAFSTDGRTLISGGNRLLYLHDASSGERIVPTLGLPAKEGGYREALVANDGRLVMCAGDTDLHIWDLDHPENFRSIEAPAEITVMTISLDGKMMAEGDENGEIRVRDIGGDFKILHSFYAENEINALAFTPDGLGLVSGDDDDLAILWSLESGKQKMVFTGSSSSIVDLVVSDFGDILMTAGRDRMVRSWSIPDGDELSSFLMEGQSPEQLVLLNEGRSLLARADSKEVWGRLLKTFEKKGPLDIAAVEESAVQLADPEFARRQKAVSELTEMGREVIPILEQMDVSDPELRSRIEGVRKELRAGASAKDLKVIYQFENSFSHLTGDPLGRFWICQEGGGSQAQLVLGEVREQQLTTLQTLPLPGGAMDISFSPDGGHLVVLNGDGSLSLYSVKRD